MSPNEATAVGMNQESGRVPLPESTSSGIHASRRNEAGRPLDALIAEKVMGWEPCIVANMPWQMIPPGEDRYIVRNVPHYSTDIAAAWLVVEKLRADGFDFELRLVSCWTADFDHPVREAGSDDADTAPLAICRAALAAAEVSA